MADSCLLKLGELDDRWDGDDRAFGRDSLLDQRKRDGEVGPCVALTSR